MKPSKDWWYIIANKVSPTVNWYDAIVSTIPDIQDDVLETVAKIYCRWCADEVPIVRAVAAGCNQTIPVHVGAGKSERISYAVCDASSIRASVEGAKIE